MDFEPQERVLNLVLKRVAIKSDFLSAVREEALLTGKRIEKLLVERGLVPPHIMAVALAEYLRMPPISLVPYTPTEELLKVMPLEVLRQYKVVPITLLGGMLTLAVADPFDALGLDQIRLIAKLNVVPVVASEKEVLDILDRFAGTEEEHGFEEVLDGTADDVEVTHEEELTEDAKDLAAQASGAPVIRVVNSILVEGMRKRASGVHIEPMEKKIQVRYRIDGVLYPQPSPPKSMVMALTSRIKIMANLNIAEHRVPQDGRFRMRALGKDCDLRVSFLPTVHGEKIVMRILDRSALAPNVKSLGLDTRSEENLIYAISQPYGMVLVTGPTGSGKTTTLYSALQELNEPDLNVVTIEDPVEYQLHGVNQVQVRQEIGLSFALGLRSILRQSPDVVMVGEIRDDETATIAVQAAMTGHLVFSTLHTNDAAGAVARMLYMGIGGYMLASALLCAQSQRLFRKVCTACREEWELPGGLLHLHHIDEHFFDGARLYKARGCPKCANTGYHGRSALMEILLVSDAMRELIVKETSSDEIRHQAIKEGMVSLRELGLQRAKDGLTSLEEILMVTSGA